MNDDDKGLLEAVSAAIDEETVHPEPETPSESGQTEDEVNPEGGNDAPEANTDDVSDPPEGEDSAEEESKPADDPDDGEDSAGDSEEKPEEEERAEFDPVNDPIPENATQRTRERIETLVGRVKEAEQYRESYTELVGMIESTGATPEAFSNMLNYMRLVNSQNPDDRRQALKAAQAELEALAIQLGESNVPGFDPLARFDDLRNAVEAQDLTAEHAREIALARLRQQDELARHTQRQQETLAQQNARQAVEQGTQALNSLEARLKAADPEYQAKRDVLVPLLKDTMRAVHPSQWAATFESAYRNFKLPTVSAPAAPRPAPPKNQPLRAKNPAGNSDRGINSPLDAINAALEGM